MIINEPLSESEEAEVELVVPPHVLAILQAEIRPTRKPGEFSEKEFNVWFSNLTGEQVGKDRSRKVLDDLLAKGLVNNRKGIVNKTQGYWWRWA